MKRIKIAEILALCIFCSGCATTQKNTDTEIPAEETVVEFTAEELEYQRSTKAVSGSVTREVFEEDKKIILKKIEELADIMTRKSYDEWTTYLDEDSKFYWNKRANLQIASSRLPVKIRLQNLKDYFTYVFIPARTGHEVDEIRYVSENSVKAVNVSEEKDVVYYTFRKINGIWQLHLPALDE